MYLIFSVPPIQHRRKFKKLIGEIYLDSDSGETISEIFSIPCDADILLLHRMWLLRHSDTYFLYLFFPSNFIQKVNSRLVV